MVQMTSDREMGTDPNGLERENDFQFYHSRKIS